MLEHYLRVDLSWQNEAKFKFYSYQTYKKINVQENPWLTESLNKTKYIILHQRLILALHTFLTSLERRVTATWIFKTQSYSDNISFKVVHKS